MKNQFIFLSFIFLLIACGERVGQKKSLDVSEESIDKYIEEKLDTSQNYEIVTGLRFSKGEETYASEQFSQNDTVILCTEEIVTSTGILFRNFFFKNDLPVYIEEYETINTPTTDLYRQRKIYLNGAIILKAYEKTAGTEDELIKLPFKEITMSLGQFDFQRPKDAALQEGDYEMKFGEFLVFDLQSFLVLDNKESGWSVALYILKGDELVEELYANPEENQGKTIHPYHDFMVIGGLDRVVYMGGYVVE